MNGKWTDHGSLWTRKLRQDRHCEHVRNCVKDSQAWHQLPREVKTQELLELAVETLAEVVEERAYVRIQKPRSVKVFKHESAYEVLNDVLHVDAPYGPYSLH